MSKENQAHMIPDENRMYLYATKRHVGQTRKDGSPYINHPYRVCALAKIIANEIGCNDHEVAIVACAALGHDLMEDCSCSHTDIETISGTEVANVVSMVSNDKRLPKSERAREYEQRLRAASKLAQIVKLADIYDNASDLLKILGSNKPPIRFGQIWKMKATNMLICLDKVINSPYYTQTTDLLTSVHNELIKLSSLKSSHTS